MMTKPRQETGSMAFGTSTVLRPHVLVSSEPRAPGGHSVQAPLALIEYLVGVGQGPRPRFFLGVSGSKDAAWPGAESPPGLAAGTTESVP